MTDGMASGPLICQCPWPARPEGQDLGWSGVHPNSWEWKQAHLYTLTAIWISFWSPKKKWYAVVVFEKEHERHFGLTGAIAWCICIMYVDINWYFLLPRHSNNVLFLVTYIFFNFANVNFVHYYHGGSTLRCSVNWNHLVQLAWWQHPAERCGLG